jgi:predicted ester cyclase
MLTSVRSQSWLFAVTPKRCRAEEIGPCSTNSLRTDFFDHTPQPGGTRDKAGVLALYKRLREAFPDFTPEIHWQRVDGDVVTTFKTYHGTHRGNFLGIAGTGTKVSFETVDAMRVVNGKISEHWGVANLYSVMQQLGAIPPLPQA